MDVGQGTLPAGFQFGAYVIGSCIGRGGMARIYRAEHRMLRKPVALKVMESVLLERPDGRPRFLREGQAAAAVKHPNVVDITDVGVWQGRPYLVMELLEGEDLEQYLGRHKPLAEQDVARIMIPIIAGLATAHAAGVIHRDLKPSNVFLSRGPDGEVVPKLLDFGISKLANSLRTLDPASTPVGELMGSPMYMSPEAVRGARDLSPQSDQYSIGVLLYECITGRPPFYGDSLLAVLEAVAHAHFESPRRYRPDLSTVLEVAILRAMSREPGDRYPSVRDLGRALCEAADQRTRLLWTPSFGVRDVPLHRNTANLGASPLGVNTLRTGSPLSASVRGRPRRFPYWQLALSALALMMVALVTVALWRMPRGPYAEVLRPAGASPAASAAATVSSGSAPAAVGAIQPPATTPAGVSSAGVSSAGVSSGGVSSGGVSAGSAAPSAELAVATKPPPAARPSNVGERSATVVDAPAHHAESAPPSARASTPPSAPQPVAASKPAPPPSRPAPVQRATAEEAEAPHRVPPPPSEVEAEAPRAPVPNDADEVVFPVRAPGRARPTPVLGANQSPILD